MISKRRHRSRARRRIEKWWRKPKARKRLAVALALTIAIVVLVSSHDGPPENLDDVCAIFDEKRSWYRATRRSFEEWGVPQAVQMAFIHQESRFQQRVRPPRKKILWIFPGQRPSTAYGYGQVMEGTWRQYQEATGRRGATRDDFADVAHFIGWYGDRIHRFARVPKDDAFNLYLGYLQGPQGYVRGHHRNKPRRIAIARKVAARAARYQAQLEGCRERLDRWWVFW